MIIMYAVCVAVSVCMCAGYYLVDVRRSNTQNLMLLSVAVANIGYLSRSIQIIYSDAVLAQKIIYLGVIAVPMFYFFSVCEYCNIVIKQWVKAILVTIQALIFVHLCCADRMYLSYKDIVLKSSRVIDELRKLSGPIYTIFTISIISYLLIALFVAVYTFRKQKNVDRAGIIVLISCIVVAVGAIIVQNVFTPENDYSPIILTVLLIGALIPIYQADVYSVAENEEVIKEQLAKVGFVTFDSRMNYRGANECALKMFEELRDAPLGHPLENPSDEMSLLADMAEKFINDKGKVKDHYHILGAGIKVNDRNYEIIIHSLKDFRKKCVGAAVEMVDFTDHVKVLELTERYNDELATDVEKKTKEIRNIRDNTILGIAQMVESRDLSTGGHIKRTSNVVRIFSEKLLEEGIGFDRDFLNLIIRSAPMHDIGKIGVDDEVLRKRDKFTPEEYEKMKKHSEIGGKLIKDVLAGVEEEDFVNIATNVAYYHHEKVNGEGYPMGLKGDEIPIEARIMALADVFDALVSKRCYKEAFSYEEAFSVIREEAGEHFDRELANIFLSCRSELEDYYNNTNIEN